MHYNKIGIITKKTDPNANSIAKELSDILLKLNCQVLTNIPHEELSKQVELIFVVGGDGTMLNAARASVDYKVPIVGINRGKIGFLADIYPENLASEVKEILNKKYIAQKRLMLNGQIIRNNKISQESYALNDIVLYNANVARLISFEVWVNDEFVLKQRADGIIIATPTGSTAYALSAGGPILAPTMEVISLVPMLPHTLSSRPIVIPAKNKIELKLSPEENNLCKLTYDGQVHFDVTPEDKIIITRHPNLLEILHPQDYDYHQVLRKKLGWNNN